MKQHPITIVLTGGGSGGHIMPLLSLARELKAQEPDCQLVYIGHRGDRFDSLNARAPDFDFTAFINGGKFRRYHSESVWSHLLDIKTVALNIRDVFRVIRSIFSSLRVLRKFRPDVVFSKGGFVAVPVGVAARLLRIPIITHDSDTTGGLANRIVGRWAVIHATGMPAEYYSYPQSSIRHVGIPVSDKIKPVDTKLQAEAKRELGLPPSSQVLLVGSGGNGSRTINQLVVAIAPSLLEANLALHIVHITGADHLEQVAGDYKSALTVRARERVKTLAFSDEFFKYVAAADLIIGRAGATALAEFALAAKACIIIPSPFLAGGHQLKNAEELAKKDAAVIVSNRVEPDELLGIVSELLGNDNRRRELAKNLASTAKPGAAAKLAAIIVALAKKSGEPRDETAPA